MRFYELSLMATAASAALVIGCSSDNSSAGGTSDAGIEAAADAGHDSSGCPFGCATDSGGGDTAHDAAMTCAELKTQIDMLAGLARACNPNQSAQCSGSTNGICCPISVSPGDPVPVENFDQAVAAYKATCPPDAGGIDCTQTICSMNVPSNACDAPMGSAIGACQ